MLTTGASSSSADVSEKLKQLAKRLLPFTEGSFEPSPPPELLDTLTDELLVVAHDAVQAVASTSSVPLSGKAKFRLLAWLVADARGAQVPMDKPLAETVGKRLDRQVQKVRTDLLAAVAAAQVDRDRAHARARVDPAFRTQLRPHLSIIDETERLATERPSNEVYVGFHELESLLPERAPQPVQRALPPALAAALCVADEADAEPEVAAIPHDLAVALGHDGVQALWRHMEELGRCPRREGDWRALLPGLVRVTLARCAAAYNEGQVDSLYQQVEETEERKKAVELEYELANLRRKYEFLGRHCDSLYTRCSELTEQLGLPEQCETVSMTDTTGQRRVLVRDNVVE